MALLIKKRVSLDFLGEEYKDAYIYFRKISLTEYDDVFKKMREDAKEDETTILLKVLKDRFVNGEAPNETGELVAIEANDLDAFDVDCVLECYGSLTGQNVKKFYDEKIAATLEGLTPEQQNEIKVDVDPKSEKESADGSTPAHPPQKP